MNLKTTLVLLVLVAAAGALIWWGQLPPALDPALTPPPVADRGTRAVLDELEPKQIVLIKVHNANGETRLERKPDGVWNMPGNWPTRQAEVEELAQLLGNLHSRFVPLPIRTNDELKTYALDRPAVVVKLETENQKYQLAFGEKATTTESTPFTRETFLRLDERPEVVRLAPGLVALLNRPAEYYQQRRIFPAERVAKEGKPEEKVERLTARAVEVEETKKDGLHYTLSHDRGEWNLREPVRDRLDAPVRDALIAAVPDIWAERFLSTGPTPAAELLAAAAPADLASATTALFWLTPQGLLVKSGLSHPERSLTITKPNGDPITLLIGTVSTTHAKQIPRPQLPMFPGAETGLQTVFEEYRYAKLKDNGQVFEIRGDKLKDVFVSLDTLRDARVARFNTADARRVEIKHGGEDIVLEKDSDRWKLIAPVKADADTTKVTELLSKLSDLQARDKDIIDKADPKKYDLDKPVTEIVVTVEEEVKSGEKKRDDDKNTKKATKPRTLTVRVGKHDKNKKKLYVMADDWPRINVVDDSLEPLVSRSALAYRGKRLFDFKQTEVAKITIDNPTGKIVLEQSAGTWRLSSPVKAEVDSGKVEKLAEDLGKLEAVEYVNQTPKQDELESQYGLGKPALLVRIEFRDKSKPAQVLQVGKSRGGKNGYFARMADAADKASPVFAVNSDIHNELARDALTYRPPQLWNVPPEEIVSVRIHKAGQKEYALTRAANTWKISGPFEANAPADVVRKMTAELGSPKAESYKAHEAKDLAMYGLDKPMLTVSVTAKDGKEHTLLIGKPAAMDSTSRFGKLAKEPAIFQVGDSLVRVADRAALDLLDTTLLHLAPDQVERMSAKFADSSLTLEKKGDLWRMAESPAGAFPADTEATAPLGFLWANLRAERFADYGASVDWAKYGLATPAVRVTVGTRKTDGAPAPTTHTVELGKDVEGDPGARYARVDGGPGAAVLPPELARLLARTYLDYVNRNVLKFDAGAVTALQRHMGPDVLEVLKKDDDWHITKPAMDKADDKAMREMLEQLSDLRASRIAAYPVKDLKRFGLDTPSALVTIRLKSDPKPTEHIIKLGKAADDDGERFALVDDGKAVAVLPGPLSERLAGSPLTFRDRTIARFGDADRLRLERGPRTAVFSKVDGTWRLTEPLQADAEQDQLDDFLNSLARLRADALIAEKTDVGELKKYGLDRPEARWRLQSGDKEVLNLLIGDKEEKSSRRYAKLTKSDLVFLLDSKLSQKVLEEYRPRTVWTPPLDAVQIESLRYGYAKNPFVLEKAESGWQAVGKPDAKISAATVEDTLAALAGLKLTRYAVDKGANLALFGLDKPELMLEIATRSGKRVLHIGNPEGNSKRRYARVPDKDRSDVFVLDEATCERILRDLNAFGKPPLPAPPRAAR
jgi:hypothetical protein